jgi:hypothetical protein
MKEQQIFNVWKVLVGIKSIIDIKKIRHPKKLTPRNKIIKIKK